MSSKFSRLVFVFIFLINSIYGFDSKVDSLLNLLDNASHDTTRISLTLSISQHYKSTQPDIAIDWLKKSLELANDCKDSLTGFHLCYYKSLTHLELATIYVLHKRHYEWAKAHIDTSVSAISAQFENDILPKQIIKSKELLANAYNILGRIYLFRGDLNEAITNYTKAAEFFHDIDNPNALARINNNLGVLHRRQSNYAKSLNHFQKALDYFESQNDTIAIASLLTNIGSVSFDIGALENSLENYLKALTIFEKKEELEPLASTLINIGGVIGLSKSHNESIAYYQRALQIFREINDERGIATSYLSIGISYKEQNLLDSAFIYLTKSVKAFIDANDRMGESDAHQNIGEVYLLQNQYAMAEKSFRHAISIASEIDFNSVLVNANHMLSLVFLKQGKIQEALALAKEALVDSRKYRLIKDRKEIHKTISSIYEKQGNYEQSLYHHKLFFALNDSVYSTERSHKFAEMETLYKLEQKQAAISRLEKERTVRDIELKSTELQLFRQRTRYYIALGLLLFLSVVMYLLYRQYRINRYSNALLKQQYAEILQKNEEIIAQNEEIAKQKQELEKQKKLITEKSEQLERFNWLLTDSIDYASSIQGALLPSKEIFDSFFNDHFIILFPKDVVSGDFYWAYPKDDTIILALADCTGHGVPGGFMSMLGISALTELMGRQIMEPADILNNLRLIVIDALKQTGRIGEHQEGMDISIISYTKGTNYIHFAGANHPLWLVRHQNDETEFSEFKGDRMPISFFHRMEPFTSQRIEIQQGDKIYLFSDGFRHQLGGKNHNRKFGKENFKKLVLSNAAQPMDQQRNVIEDAFFRWVSGYDQIDDINIIGLEV